MIEVNLVPDVKQEFIRAQRQRTLAVSVAIMVGLVAVAIVVLLGILIGAQALRNKLADDQIKKQYSTLQHVPNLSNLLTIQHQLGTLSDQNDNRTMDSRIFDVLTAINPAAPNDVKFSSIKLDPVNNVLTLDGTAVGGYAATDTLKKTILASTLNYTKDDSHQSVALTSNVNIDSTSYGQDNTGAQVLQFSISFTYASDLFSNTISNAQISGPTGQTDVTDSKLHVPDSMFSAKPNTDASGGSN